MCAADARFAIAKFLLTIGRLLLHCWYSIGRPVTIGTPMVLRVFGDWFSVPIVKNSQKAVKIATITIGVLSSHVNAESAEYTKPRKRRYLAKPPSHVPDG